MVTGLATAKLDSIPIVYYGQVQGCNWNRCFSGSGYLWYGFSSDKYSYLVMDINDLASTIKEAFVVASQEDRVLY